MSSYSVIYLSQDGSKSDIKLFCGSYAKPESLTTQENDDNHHTRKEPNLEIEIHHQGNDQLSKETESVSTTKRRFSERIRNVQKAALPKEPTNMRVGDVQKGKGREDTSGVQLRETRHVTRSSSRKGSTSNPTVGGKGSTSNPTVGTSSAAKKKNTMPTKGSEKSNPKATQCESKALIDSSPSESTSFGSSLNAEQSEIDDDSSKALKRKRTISEVEEDIETSKVAKSKGTPSVEGSSEYTDLNNVLLVRQLEDSTQLNEARKELIRGWKDYTDNLYSVGIKRMGELDPKPFRDACSTRNQSDIEALKLCSLWQSKLSDSSWHPLQVVQKDGEEAKEILKESDEGLKTLKADYGVEVYDAVHRGLVEINEYNPSGRYPIEELWNFKENRRATLKEAISVLFKMKKD